MCRATLLVKSLLCGAIKVMSYSNIEVQVLVNGKPVKKYSHGLKTYIQANKGTSYSILLKNNSYGRKLFRVSVDGIDVITGSAAGQSTTGYIVNGYSSYEVKGFRTSNETVNLFAFSDKKRSYAAKSEETQGDISNCGVIGVKVFDEYSTPVIYFNQVQNMSPISSDGSTTVSDWMDTSPKITFSCSNNSLHARSASASHQTKSCNFDVGTEFTKVKVEDRVSEVDFQTGNLVGTFLVYYASNHALREIGVPINKIAAIPKEPNAFPSRFCKPPR